MIKVILKEDVVGQGKRNDVIDVSDGFARNFLIPRNKAILATPDEINKIKEEKDRSDLKEEKIKGRNKKLKERVDSLKITIQKKAKEGKLFGSIAPKEISDELSREGINIDPKKIIMESPIKTVGTYKVGIMLDKNIKADLTINVTEEK